IGARSRACPARSPSTSARSGGWAPAARCGGPPRSACALPSEGEALCSIQSVDALVVYAPALTAQKHVGPPVSEAGAFHCTRTELVEERRGRRPPGRVAAARTGEPQHPAGAALAHLESAAQEADCLAVRRRLHHFFETTAFRAWLSSVRSATRCF